MNIFIFCFLLITVSAGPKDKKTTLEDIERDYISNERKTKLTPPPKVATPAPSPTQFGFVPKKTVADYARQEHRPAYVQPQYTQQYVPQQAANDYSQYSTAQQYKSTVPQSYSAGLLYPTPQQKYTPQISNQQAYSYVTQLPNQLQSLENVQYITDNSISAPATQQYFTPQYVYFQQYSSPSTAVQTVVEPKGALQYVMYVPAYVASTAADQGQNYENVYSEDDSQAYTPSYQVSQSPQYITQQPQPKQQFQYVQPKNKLASTEYIIKREPKSLLDSYIPSIVQLQYYKQTQQNSVQEPVKVSQTVSGKEYVKSSYRPEGPSGAETSLTYRYQPSSYRS
ncbi:uncharacterized protein LOC108912831 [Anoplophora glabripennis]|uniref:uncharacterized protein LOC108912831 n=1 Tax=Anoplophora glabripennis TaxID=217634 RepID=UPI000874E5D9|nr:uncharacterized protein LOC108912831 [Anoplophora glabripennis]